jgi:hypothetical protein
MCMTALVACLYDTLMLVWSDRFTIHALPRPPVSRDPHSSVSSCVLLLEPCAIFALGRRLCRFLHHEPPRGNLCD